MSDLDTKVSESKFAVVDDGVYKAKVVDIKVKDGKYGKMLQWTFEIFDHDEFGGVQITGISPKEATEKSKLYTWVTNILGTGEISIGDTLPVSKCIGKSCKVLVVTSSSEKDPDKTYSNVSKVLPRKKDSAESEKPKAKPAEEDEDEKPSKKRESDDDLDTDTKSSKKSKASDDDEDVEEKPAKKKKVEEDDDDIPF
jgi:hypothetical protein